ncbi:MAG: hypothetical protein JWR46_3494 [Mycobacterium sp.]|nr:hypothetical protein [Mycobacterium sp.]
MSATRGPSTPARVWRMRRVVVWGTGNMGPRRSGPRSRFPGCNSSASSPRRRPSRAGTQRHSPVSMPRPASSPRRTSMLALAACDAVAYMASGDIRPDEAVGDIERCLRAGAHVVTPSRHRMVGDAEGRNLRRSRRAVAFGAVRRGGIRPLGLGLRRRLGCCHLRRFRIGQLTDEVLGEPPDGRIVEYRCRIDGECAAELTVQPVAQLDRHQ